MPHINARWNCQVTFTARPHPEYTRHATPEGAEICAGIVNGATDSVWVHTKTQTHADAIAAAARKMALGFGVLIENPKVITGGGFWH